MGRDGIGRFGACATTASVFGVLAGVGGATHGVGEVLQGNVPVEGIWLESWTSGPIARNMGGEPGITLLPTALGAGLITLALSLGVITWAIVGVRRDRGGMVLMGLSLGLLLSGGGVGPPVIGMLAGAVGRWGPGRRPRRVERMPARTRRRVARAWPALFAVAAANGVLLVVGSLVLVYAFDVNRPSLFEGSFYLSVGLLLLLLLTAPAYDAQHGAAAAGRTGRPGRDGPELQAHSSAREE